MPVSDAAPVLTARNLVAGYLPGINILNGMSVDVLRGEVRCVLGPNGTGKSTLLKVLFGFLPAQRGEMRLGDMSLHGIASHRHGAARHHLPTAAAERVSVPVGGGQPAAWHVVLSE